ncbi:MAG: GFA family protein [Myxococcales bacterium]|nr:GFA family protein [Myxococcales bacterium]
MGRTGSCQCGTIRYEVEGDSLALVFCQCTECQKLSAGIGSYSMVLPREALRIVSGEPRSWERSSETGARNRAWMCPECGNRIFHENPDDPAMIRLKAGTLDDAAALEPDALVWRRSAPAWMQAPEGVARFESQPTPEEFFAAMTLFQGRAQR